MNTGVKCDHTVVLTGLNSSAAYPNTLRRVHYYDTETEKYFNFLTNNFVCSAQTSADLYRYHWQRDFTLQYYTGVESYSILKNIINSVT